MSPWDMPPIDSRAAVLPVLELVAHDASVEVIDIIRPRKCDSRMVKARAVAMYLARELTDCSWHELGRAFKRDHTTVLHAHRKVATGPLRAVAASVAARAGIVLS